MRGTGGTGGTTRRGAKECWHDVVAAVSEQPEVAAAVGESSPRPPLRARVERSALVTAAGGIVAVSTGIAGIAVRGHGAPGWLVALLWGLCGLGVVVATVCGLLVAVGSRARFRWWWQLLAVALEVAVAGLVLLFVKAPDLYPPVAPVPDATLQAARETARASSIASLRTAVVAGLAGLAAVGGLMVNAVNSRLSARTLELSREGQDLTRHAQATAQAQAERTAQATQASLELTAQGQLTDRYAKAIELLGSENLTVRLGGVYALSQIATDTTRPSDQTVVVEVLSIFVRRYLHARPDIAQPAPDGGPAADEGTDGREPRADVLAAVSVLAQLPERSGVGLRADFTGLDFTGLQLSNARFRGEPNGVRLLTPSSSEGTSTVPSSPTPT